MRIGIVGWGIEGQSAMRYFGAEHEYLIVNEHPRDDFPPESEKVIVEFLPDEKPPGVTGNAPDLSYLKGLEACDKIIYSVTSYHNLQKAFGDDKFFWKKVTSVMQIFFEESPTKNIIGVTGTKGKGTTSTLIYQMLKEVGKPAYLAGNIGTSALDLLGQLQEDDYVVLEMSSYQLFNFPYSPRIGVCLRISPEHLDWHTNMEDYVEAKANIFKHQTKEDIAIYFAENEYSQQIAGYSEGQKIPYFSTPGAWVKDTQAIVIGDEETEVIKKSEVKLLGDHNLENVCAALTAFWQVSQDKNAAHKVLSSFTGLEHRLELVRELNGVKYYDDSFGTNPETAIVALKAVVRPVVLIAGGYDRGIPQEPLVDYILKSRIRHVITIGQTGQKLDELLAAKGFKKFTSVKGGMPEIVAAAHAKAEQGDAVLLSAAASSFDMFKDFVDRGNQFKEAVKAL